MKVRAFDRLLKPQSQLRTLVIFKQRLVDGRLLIQYFERECSDPCLKQKLMSDHLIKLEATLAEPWQRQATTVPVPQCSRV